jgi:stage III sporulation protein SpoIIIAA
MQQWIETDQEVVIEKLPPRIAEKLVNREDKNDLLEVILDLGRVPEARFSEESVVLSDQEVTDEDIQHVIHNISPFGGDNRAGIERTLHRISAIRNRPGKVVGLTIRVGRAVYGTIRIIEDIVLTGKSILLLGKPGVGKTTMLREVARVLADDAGKRVVIVDTSNEIAGDGDIPHPGIGKARRMQVPSPDRQHAVMIEAVENHMPEVIIIDEIGTELEATAARTIAERGVQLVATAHGNTLENLIQNPTLSDLIGGIQSVTLGDIEARRRRTQKTVLERKAPPTFDVLVEIQGRNQVLVALDVGDTVDQVLRGITVRLESRSVDREGHVQRTQVERRPGILGQGRQDKPTRYEYQGSNGKRDFDGPTTIHIDVDDSPTVDEEPEESQEPEQQEEIRWINVLPYGVNKGKIEQAVQSVDAPIKLVDDLAEAELVLTTKSFYRRRTNALRRAEEQGRPVYVLRKNTTPQIHQFFRAITRNNNAHHQNQARITEAVEEAEEAARHISDGEHQAELNPQSSYVRHLQHEIAERHGLSSSSSGREPKRRVVIYKS